MRHGYNFGGPWCGCFHFGMGMGMGMRLAGNWFWHGPFPTVEEELRWLEEYKKWLQEELAEVEKRINRLSK